MTTQLATLAAHLEAIPYNDENRYDVALDAGPAGNLLRVHDNKFYKTIFADKVDPNNVKGSVIKTIRGFLHNAELSNVAHWRELIKNVEIGSK